MLELEAVRVEPVVEELAAEHVAADAPQVLAAACAQHLLALAERRASSLHADARQLVAHLREEGWGSGEWKAQAHAHSAPGATERKPYRRGAPSVWVVAETLGETTTELHVHSGARLRDGCARRIGAGLRRRHARMRAERGGLRKKFFRQIARIENRLRAAFAVADVDEDEAAEIASGVNPAVQSDRLSDVRRAQFVAMVRAFHVITQRRGARAGTRTFAGKPLDSKEKWAGNGLVSSLTPSRRRVPARFPLAKTELAKPRLADMLPGL